MSRTLWLLSGLALLFRVVWVWVADAEPVSDFSEYVRLATNLAEHGWFGRGQTPSAYRSPGWPAVLSVSIRLAAEPALAGGFLNALFATLTLPAIYALAQRWGGQRAGLWAALLWVGFPGSIVGVAVLANEPLFVCLLTWGLVAFESNAGTARLAVAGLLFGTASYVRAEALVVPAALAFVYVWARGFTPLGTKFMGRLFLPAVIGLVCVLPWGIRNQAHLGAFVLTPTNAGVNFYLANNAHATGGYLAPHRWPEPLPDNELAQNSAGYRRGWQWIGHNPLRFLALVPQKWKQLWGPGADFVPYALNDAKWDKARGGVGLFCQLAHLALLSLAGVALMQRRPRAPLPALVMLALWFGIHLFFHGAGRLHAPLVPIWCALAGSLADLKPLSRMRRD